MQAFLILRLNINFKKAKLNLNDNFIILLKNDSFKKYIKINSVVYKIDIFDTNNKIYVIIKNPQKLAKNSNYLDLIFPIQEPISKRKLCVIGKSDVFYNNLFFIDNDGKAMLLDICPIKLYISDLGYFCTCIFKKNLFYASKKVIFYNTISDLLYDDKISSILYKHISYKKISNDWYRIKRNMYFLLEEDNYFDINNYDKRNIKLIKSKIEKYLNLKFDMLDLILLDQYREKESYEKRYNIESNLKKASNLPCILFALSSDVNIQKYLYKKGFREKSETKLNSENQFGILLYDLKFNIAIFIDILNFYKYIYKNSIGCKK
ncbi:MAG: hypothetical protein GYA16_13960 [Spirochaetes bacterium]|nr:hypothetical protein [Spirochaetota bacterium]